MRRVDVNGRRRFIAASAAMLASSLAGAQQEPAVRVLAILSPNPVPTPEQIAGSPALQRLRELGWIEGRNLRVDRAFAGGEANLPALAAELVQKRVDLIWTTGPQATSAAARATSTIPIVFRGVTDPVRLGLVDSLARPGRNVTGVTYGDDFVALTSKRIELLKEALPAARRVAWMGVTQSGGMPAHFATLRAAARKLDIDLHAHPLKDGTELDAVFGRVVAGRSQALLVEASFPTGRVGGRIIELAHRNRIPTVHGDRYWVESGALVSYGPGNDLISSQSLGHVDRILRGARPAELPVEMPSRYEVAVNLRTASALGVRIPRSVLIRADRVLE